MNTEFAHVDRLAINKNIRLPVQCFALDPCTGLKTTARLARPARLGPSLIRAGLTRPVYFNYFPCPARCKPVNIEARPGPARPGPRPAPFMSRIYLVQQTFVPEILNTI